MNFIDKIGLGTVQFGLNYGISNRKGKTDIAEVSKILGYAEKVGIDTLDTASAYGDAEKVLGNNNLSHFRIISKYIPDNINTLQEQFNQSLTHLNINVLYAYMAHRPLDLLENDRKNWEILYKLKSEKKVKKIGASFNDIKEMDCIFENEIHLDIVQVPYNFLDRRFEPYMRILKDHNCEIHTRSTFLQGLFFCDVDKLSSHFNQVKDILRELQKINNLASSLLRFVVEQDFIDKVIIGVNNTNQLKRNIKSLKTVETHLLGSQRFEIEEKVIIPSLWPKI